MIFKKIFRWHFKARRFRQAKQLEMFEPPYTPFPLFEKKKRPAFLGGTNTFTYEKPIRRHFFRYLFLILLGILFTAWFFSVCIEGWGIYSGNY